MKTVFSKSLCLILCAVLALGTVLLPGAVASAAENGDLSETIHWSYAAGTLSITGTGDVPTGALKDITSAHAEDIVTVTVGEGITSLCRGAFNLCANLKKVSLPASLRSIPNGCFKSCALLTEIAIPAGVQFIGDSAFYYCTALEKVTFGSGLLCIGGDAFRGCAALKSVKLPAKLNDIGFEAFADSGLESVTLPKSVRMVAGWSFARCPALKTAILSAGVTSLPDCVFQNSGLESVVLPKSIKTVNSTAFYNCPIKHVYYEGTRAEFEQIDMVKADSVGKFFEAENVVTAQVHTDLGLKRGDVNSKDGVTAADARAALRAAVNLEPIAAGTEQFYITDTDGDAKISAADARKILRAAVSLEDLKTVSPYRPPVVSDDTLTALEAFSGSLNDLLKQYDTEILYSNVVLGLEGLVIFYGSSDIVVMLFDRAKGLFFKHRFSPTADAAQLEAAVKNGASAAGITALAPDTAFNVFGALGEPVTRASISCTTDSGVYLIAYKNNNASSISRF